MSAPSQAEIKCVEAIKSCKEKALLSEDERSSGRAFIGGDATPKQIYILASTADDLPEFAGALREMIQKPLAAAAASSPSSIAQDEFRALSMNVHRLNEKVQKLEMDHPVDVTSRVYFTDQDVVASNWFDKLDPTIVQQCVNLESVLGLPDVTLLLRASLRYLWLREVKQPEGLICGPVKSDDEEADAKPKQKQKQKPQLHNLEWLRVQREPAWQHVVMQVLSASVGGQQSFEWLKEDSSRPKPREDFIGMLNMTQVTSAEMKKLLSNSLAGNAQAFGQLMQYASRDVAKSGDFVGVFAVSLSYFFFVRIHFDAPDSVSSYQIFPPLLQSHNALFLDVNTVNPKAEYLSEILPLRMPDTFTHLVQFTDCVCKMNGVDIVQPVFTFSPRGSPAPGTLWELTSVEILQSAARSLILAADPPLGSSSSSSSQATAIASDKRVIIKVADHKRLATEERIHKLVDGKVANIRQLVGTIRIVEGTKNNQDRCFSGIVLSPFGKPLEEKLSMERVDTFLTSASIILRNLHNAGVLHRDVKVT